LRLASLSAVAVLAACSGGTTNPGINGLAATGAALANASVTVKCASGTPLIGTTGVDGNYSIDLGLGQNAPCMVQVTNGTVTLYSFASAAGRVNITPLTDLVVTKALGSDPASAFASYSSATGNTITAGMSAAKAYVSAQITTLIGGTQSGDPITGVFKVGDANDKVLDDLAAKLLTDGKSQGDLHQAAITGGTLVTSLNRGTLVASPAGPFFTFTKAQFDGSPLFAITGPAVCDVKVVPLNYNTVGVSGEAANASGVMLVPTGSGLGCSSPAALVAYAKGTDVQKPRTLANPADGETFLLAATYAAKGYVVVATDYLGFAQSTYAYHPYLHADSEASSVIDSIRAARKAATSVGATLSGKVMVTGYSQGGHASMAAHRAIERDNASEINLVAGAHLAGPYNMSGSLKVPAAIAGVQFFVPYLVTAWQKVYGNIYSSVATAFKAPYASYIETLLPHPTLTYGTLPYDTTTTPPTLWLPGALSETPDQARDAMFQAAFITDIQTNNSSPLYVAAKKNDLLGWNPKSKLLLCGGAGDPTVSPAVHQNVMKADFDSRGLTNVSSVDVDASVFAVYGGGLPGTAATYYGNYHGTYEPPFCHAAAVAVFNTVK
ncbi:MAG: hypothetical protein RLZZ573_1352, partial [Pseudomonadota bacterium]